MLKFPAGGQCGYNIAMYISSVTVNNFRGVDSSTAEFKPGFNLIIGPNDSGKTTFIDAIRIALGTRTDERLSVLDTDIRDSGPLPRIDLTIKFADEEEESRWFVEYLTPVETGELQLNIYCTTEQSGTGYYFQRKLAGPSFETAKELSAPVMERLRTTYLKPIRDASQDLGSSQYSRLARILKAHSKVEKNKDALFDEYNRASNEINKLFAEVAGVEGVLYSDTTKTVQKHYASFSEKVISDKTQIGFKNPSVRSDRFLQSILQKLDIWTDGHLPGLGTANTLYMAAELMLLDDVAKDYLKTGLIEELEAHIHPTRQLKIAQSLQKLCDNDGTQIIATSHSPNLASRARIENLLVAYEGELYTFDEESTALRESEGDYKYLERFLDVTKSSMFFARGVIFVEGPTELFMIPAFAEALGFNLVDYGVSVINLNNLGFDRFTKAFTRSGSRKNPVPVAVVTDADEKMRRDLDGGRDDRENKIQWHYGLTVEDEPISSLITGTDGHSATFEKIILATRSSQGPLYKLYRKAYRELYGGELPEEYDASYKRIEKKKAPLAQMVSIYILDVLNGDSPFDGSTNTMGDVNELDTIPTKEELVSDIKTLFPNINAAIMHAAQIEQDLGDSDASDNDNR